MQLRTSKALALLGGVATLALGSTIMLRLSPPKAKQVQAPCAPRLLELEQAVCEPVAVQELREQLAQLSIHASN